MFVLLELLRLFVLGLFETLTHTLVLSLNFFVAHENEGKLVFESFEFSLLLHDGFFRFVIVEPVEFIVLFIEIFDLLFVFRQLLIDGIDVVAGLVELPVILPQVIFVLVNDLFKFFEFFTFFVELVDGSVFFLVEVD